MPLAMQPQVLVVGDDPRHRELLQSYLQGLTGTTLVAAHGADGVRLAQALRPKVLVIDYPLVHCAAEDLCSAVKRDSANARLKVLLVGDLGSPDFNVEAMIESGADDCCPLVKDEFRKRVQILLQFP